MDEAKKICYRIGLPIAAVPFIKRMLDLERRVIELESAKGFTPPGTERR